MASLIKIHSKINNRNTPFFCSADDEREEAISSGGLDLIVVPGLGFTKVGGRVDSNDNQ